MLFLIVHMNWKIWHFNFQNSFSVTKIEKAVFDEPSEYFCDVNERKNKFKLYKIIYGLKGIWNFWSDSITRQFVNPWLKRNCKERMRFHREDPIVLGHTNDLLVNAKSAESNSQWKWTAHRDVVIKNGTILTICLRTSVILCVCTAHLKQERLRRNLWKESQMN